METSLVPRSLLLARSAFAFLLSLTCLVTAFAQDRNQAMNIVYPTGAFQQNGGPVINIKSTTLFTPNAVGDGITDDTAAFVAMMDYIKNRLIATGKADPRLTIYLPSGTYLVSDTIIHTGSISGGFSYLRMVGQNRANTTIKLKNNSVGFGAGQAKPVITWTKYAENYQGNVMWGNALRNITIDTGTGNPGAVGMAFFGANGCSIDNVTIRSGDGFGNTGLFFPGWSVQGHMSDITVDGFDYGVRLTDHRETNPNLEYLTLRNQKIRALQVGPALVTVRKLLSQNSIPAISAGSSGAQLVLLDSRLEGGAAGEAAIRTIASSLSQVFLRNVQVAGYGASVNVDGTNVLTGNISEWLNGTIFSINSSTPPKTMNLPVEEVELVPWESNVNNWASPEQYTGTDAQKIQAALNSGKTAVFIPKAYNAGGATLTIPATVRQISFLYQNITNATFRINEASATGLWLENPQNRLPVHLNASRKLHVRDGGIRFRVLTSAPVTAHFQTLAVLAGGSDTQFCPANAKIYGRSLNEESSGSLNFLVNGGLLWTTGYKTERPYTAFEVRNGGFLEVLGGYQNFAGSDDIGQPVVLNNNSNASYVGSTHMSRTYWEGIWEIRNGVTTKIRNTDFPRRTGPHNSGNYVVPLYVGYDPSSLPSGQPVEVIIDNSDTTGLEVTGAWSTSTWTEGGAFYGANYMHDGNTGKGSKSVRYRPNLAAGTYDVFIRYSSSPERASNVPINVAHAGGTDFISLDQRTGGGQWVLLGRYSFNAGTGGNVLISNAGTTSWVVADAVRFTPVVQVIVDNSDSTGVQITGTWTASTFDPGYQGINYLHDGNTGKGTKTVRFSPLLTAGSYQVSIRYTANANRASNVPISITHAGGTSSVTLDQRTGGAQWVTLGTYNYNAGTAGNVLISTTGTNGFVIADAVRFARQN